MRQVLPFHRSASVRMIPSVPTYSPTATHEVALAQDTSWNCALGVEVSTGGTACTDHGDFAAAADADRRESGRQRSRPPRRRRSRRPARRAIAPRSGMPLGS